MNLKVRLALLYSLSVFIILVTSGISIYLINENVRKDEFVKRLVSGATKTYAFYFSVPSPDKEFIEDLNQNLLLSLPDASVFILDSLQHVIYKTPGSVFEKLPEDQLAKARATETHYFKENDRETVLLYASQRNKKFYVMASAVDTYGNRKSHNLTVILTSAVLGGIFLSGLLAFFYVNEAMKPLEELKEQIDKINEKNLKERILVRRNSNNEITQIAKKFNAMIDRIEQAFEQRKNFVHHASHELRTPLANMLSQTESALGKTLDPVGYQKVLLSLQEDQQDLIDLTNSLLTLSRYEKITFLHDWSSIRIDEVLYETVDFVNKVWPNAIVTIDYETVPEHESELILEGNESLIKSAIQNLVKNGIQYSTDYRVKIIISNEPDGITVKIDNMGKQLSSEEQTRLFIPFFRGENSFNKKGYGLGLSIVERIINVHEGRISYEAIGDNINRFTVFLPRK